jgi:hypothetical protein
MLAEEKSRSIFESLTLRRTRGLGVNDEKQTLLTMFSALTKLAFEEM